MGAGIGSPLVSIICNTYNHVDYIRQCLDGFLMQKTTFPIEILVHDDASIDGTADIVREYEALYPDLIKPIYQNVNQYSKGVKVTLEYQYSRAKGKYIALCEGDDYWTDPLKLQKQVGILESSEKYVICSTDYQTFNQKDGIQGSSLAINELIEYNIDNLIVGDWFFHPLTVMFRRSSLDLAKLNSYKNTIDIILFYEILKDRGLGVFLPEVTSVYRLHSKGIWSQIDLNAKRRFEFDVRLDLCSVEDNMDTAILLLSQFQKPTSRLWMLKNIGLLGNSFVILSRFFGVSLAFRVFCQKVFLNRIFTKCEIDQLIKQTNRN